MAAPDPFGVSPPEAIETWLASLDAPMTVLAAVSGGSDSLGLLIALHQALAASRAGHRLVAATIDHGLRPAAAAEARSVAELCDEISVAHVTRRWEGEKPISGISAAAREARYRLLMEAADALGADILVTGHTLDDQIETIAMRASRSNSGDDLGLAGMAAAVLLDGRRWLMRPFLATRRDAIREFLETQGREWIDDPSNADRHYERVRVRAALQQGMDAVPSAIVAAGERRRRLAETAAGLARSRLQIRHGALAQLDMRIFDEDREAARHLVAVLTAVLGGRQHLPAKGALDRVMAFIDGRRPGRVTAGRVIFDLRRQGLFMHRENRDLPTLHIAAGEEKVWDGRYRIVNRGEGELKAGPTSPDRDLAPAMFDPAPPALSMRAMAALPHVEVAGPVGAVADKATVIVTPILAPYDRFLPQFDFILARELGVLFGCDEFPVAPIKVFERKS